MHPTSASFDFPEPLTDKYAPRTLADFVGLEKPRRIAANVIANPKPGTNLLFLGESGLGKTRMALVIAEGMPAEIHHIPAKECTLENLNRVLNRCRYVPMMGCKMHLVLIDECDSMSDAAQTAMLSVLDGTARPPCTIIIGTCNSVDRFETRFLSRWNRIPFSKEGIAPLAAKWLAMVWELEAPNGAAKPNFARLVKDSNNNVRTALLALETELMAC